MFEIEWWETALGQLASTPPAARAKRVQKLADDYLSMVETEKRPRKEVLALLEGIVKHLESPLPPFMVATGPMADKVEAGELILQPAWNEFEVSRFLEMNDGRAAGSTVIGVYKLDREEPIPSYKRVEGV